MWPTWTSRNHSQDIIIKYLHKRGMIDALAWFPNLGLQSFCRWRGTLFLISVTDWTTWDNIKYCFVMGFLLSFCFFLSFLQCQFKGECVCIGCVRWIHYELKTQFKLLCCNNLWVSQISWCTRKWILKCGNEFLYKLEPTRHSPWGHESDVTKWLTFSLSFSKALTLSRVTHKPM